MKVYLAADHTGFEVKQKVVDSLRQDGYEVEDCGADQLDPNDDYPDFISKAAKLVAQDPAHSKGIVLGGSGQGEAMAANKFAGIRAAVFYGAVVPVRAVDVTGRESTNPYEMIKLTKEHNDANVLSIGIRFVTDDEILKVIKLWLETPFVREERHLRRINKILEIEANQ